MIVSMANELRNISKRCDKDREEFLTRMKEQKQKGLDASLTKDIQLLAQQITELKDELREKNAVTPPRQREVINRLDISLVENDLPTDLTRGRVLTLRETLLTVPISDGYNVHIIEFINRRGIQNVILPQKEASVVTYFRNKLRGEARQALHQQQFTSIEQLLNRLKKAFGIVGDIFDSDAELKRLGMGNQEKSVSYINRTQTVYSQITLKQGRARGRYSRMQKSPN